MENLLNSPGLQHLAENIFLNLNYEKLKIFQMINQTSYKMLNGNPIFWIKFIRRKLSEENQKYLIRTFTSMNFGFFFCFKSKMQFGEQTLALASPGSSMLHQSCCSKWFKAKNISGSTEWINQNCWNLGPFDRQS